MTEKSLPHMFSIQTRNGSGYKEIYSSAGEKAEADFPSDFHLEKLEDMENELLKKNNACANDASTFLLVSFSDSPRGKEAVEVFWGGVREATEKVFPPSKNPSKYP